MNIFFILVGVSVVGILGVFWLLKNEDKPSLRDLGAPVPTVKPSAPPRTGKPSLLAGLFAKSKKEKKETIATVPLPSATDVVEKSFVAYQDKPEAGPAAQPTALSAAEEKKIEQEIDLAAQIEEWKGKYERLDKLFNEKSAALEKSEESLKTELNNRKEFNKLKDILEKELRDAKDKARNIQVELSAAKTEAEGNKKRVAQLEERITKMEGLILEKDDEVFALTKKLATAASVSSVVAAPEPSAPPDPPAASAVPETPAAPVVVTQAEPPAASLPAPQSEQGKEAEEREQPKEEGFLKLQPDILTVANPPAATAEPEDKKSDLGEPKQLSDPMLPEVNPQEPQDKPSSEGQTNQQDEQKKE